MKRKLKKDGNFLVAKDGRLLYGADRKLRNSPHYRAPFARIFFGLNTIK